ncbi:MAG: hypothetical protein ACI9EV_003103, partial [Urechidicola sp.]
MCDRIEADISETGFLKCHTLDCAHYYLSIHGFFKFIYMKI